MIDNARIPALKRRVARWLEKNYGRLFRMRIRLPLYVHDDDSLGIRGEDHELVGWYDWRLDVDRVVEDVVEWYAVSHPLGRGAWAKRSTAPKR